MTDRSESCPDLVMSAAIVDQWIAPHMADHGIFGAYSYEDRAIFYRRLISGYPNALDFLLDANPEEVNAFRQTVDRLYEVRTQVGSKAGPHSLNLTLNCGKHVLLHRW